jgi:multidrug efflux system membrane fusion protein
VHVEPVSLTRTAPQQRYSASVEPNVRVPLAFTSGGYVAALKMVRQPDGSQRPVQAGDPVRRGEVLIELRQSDFRARLDQAAAQLARARAGARDAAAQVQEAEGALVQASAAVEEARAAERQARGAVAELEASILQARAAQAEAEAGLAQARANHERARGLFEARALTRQDYDASLAQLEMARAKVEQAREQVRALEARQTQARAQVAQAQARVAQARGQETAAAARVERARAGQAAAQADVGAAEAQFEQMSLALGDSRLRSPLDGVLLSRQVEIGSLVAPGASGAEVADIRHVKAVFGVPDVAVEQLRLGQKVELSTESWPGRTFAGRITAISPQADPQSRVFKVEVTVPNPRGELRVGMVAALNLGARGQAASQVLTVPLAAIQKETRSGAYVVFVVEGGVARRREVRLGEAVGNRVVVLEGLREGEQVITSGASALHDGDPVQVEP